MTDVAAARCSAHRRRVRSPSDSSSGWFRARSVTLLAPILARIATNPVTLDVDWAFWH
jgi:hypothetical protein